MWKLRKSKTARSLAFFLSMAGCLCCSLSIAAEVSAISPVRYHAMVTNFVMNAQSPVPYARLRVVNFSYVDFQGQRHKGGEIIVLDAIANQVAKLFDRLLDMGFPIYQAKAMEHFQGSDEKAMDANNTSAFISRPITGDSLRISLHAYGVAIDINPVQNPYLSFGDKGAATFQPAAGQAYANRSKNRWSKSVRQGMTEQVISVFAQHGFLYWGGYWDTPIDYQHFQTSREMAEFMAFAPTSLATKFFDQYVAFYRTCEAAYPEAYQKKQFSEYTSYLKSLLKDSDSNLLSIFQNKETELKALLALPVKASPTCIIQ
ncbi:M15 family metallopeptidase [Endozoicomonas sp.]|nr:M15 family metallopeptidase [Endozoicomonas sp.]